MLRKGSGDRQIYFGPSPTLAGFSILSGIIVVDDQPTNRRIIARLAASVDDQLEVLTFGNPLDALAHVADEPPDLLITDLKMAPIEGDELIRRFRQVRECEAVPVIVVTAHAEEELRKRALRAGMTDYFLAPINHQEFTARSRHFLSLARRSRMALDVIGLDADFDLVTGGDSEVIDKAAAHAALDMVGGMMNTVNNQLAVTLADLRAVKADLRNLAEINELSVVFVDRCMLIRRYAPVANGPYHLQRHDVGKPLTAIPCDLDYHTLEQDFRRCMNSGDTVEECLPTRDGGRFFLMRMAPYRRDDGSIDGATLTFKKIGG